MTQNMKRRVQILQRETVFEHFIFRVEELQLKYQTFAGPMSAPIKRLVLDRGDAAAVLLHDPVAGLVLLCEQFRAATLEHGSGWIHELPAGMIDDGEPPEVCARREAKEETGRDSGTLTPIATVYPSPGGSSERIHVFYCNVSLQPDHSEYTGLVHEGEDIRVVLLPTNEAFEMLRGGKIQDAKTLIALQWLELCQRKREAGDI